MPEKPKAPIPRSDSGAFTMPTEYAAGPLPSIRPTDPIADLADRVGMLEAAVKPLSAAYSGLRADFDGQRVGVEALIKTTVASEMSEVKAHLSRQDATALERDTTLNRILKIVEKRDRREREERISTLDEEEKAEDIKKTRAEARKTQQEVGRGFWTKTRLIVLTLTAAVALIATLATLAGVSQHRVSSATEKPE